MRKGNWVPVSKALIKKLPSNRSFSEVEAAFSLQFAYDTRQAVSESSFAKRWGWSRRKARNFLNKMSAEITYQGSVHCPKKSGKLGLKSGQVKAQLKAQLRLIDSRQLDSTTDKSKHNSEHTLNDPNYIEPKIKEDMFNEFWQAYPKKQAKRDAQKAWEKIALTEQIFEKILEAIESAKATEVWQKQKGQFIPLPASWLRGERWKDELIDLDEQGEDLTAGAI